MGFRLGIHFRLEQRVRTLDKLRSAPGKGPRLEHLGAFVERQLFVAGESRPKTRLSSVCGSLAASGRNCCGSEREWLGRHYPVRSSVRARTANEVSSRIALGSPQAQVPCAQPEW